MRSRAIVLGLCGLLLAATLAGCGGRSKAPGPSAVGPLATRHGITPGGRYKIGKPYQVDGVWYYPGVDYSYDETGIASWYGPDFHGKYTANGEIYNMNDLTAAHPTLPLPSIVRVTNLDNGRSIVVRVNDRGPYVRGRIIDLSRRAAQLLGVIGPGTAKVRVRVMADESRQAALLAQQGEIPSVERITAALPTGKVTSQELAPPPGIATAPQAPNGRIVLQRPPVRSSGSVVASAVAAPSRPPLVAPKQSAPEPQVKLVPVMPTSIYVQVGAFSQYVNADRLRARLSPIGSARVTQVNVDGLPFFRVRMGPLGTVTDADHLLDRVVRAGYHEARIVVE